MIGDERLELCIDRTPFCAIGATVVLILGLGLLFWFQHEFVSFTEDIIKKFLNKDTCSVKEGNKWSIYLAIASGALAIAVIVLGVFTNGDIRARTFRHSTARCIGMFICIILIIIGLALICLWLRLAEFYSRYYFFFLFIKIDCVLYTKRSTIAAYACLNAIPGNFLINEKEPIKLDICKPQSQYMCDDFINRYKKHFLKFYIAFCVIVVATVFHCMCLAADFVKIRCQSKFDELEELRSLEMDLSSDEKFF